MIATVANVKNKELLLSDDTLFHFTDRITFLEKILPSNLFLLNQLKNTNDPQEYKKYDFHASTRVSTPELILLSKIEKEINDYYHNFIQISCFCVKKKNELRNTWLKPKLWSDYGDGHKGFCLMISKSAIKLELKKRNYYHGIKEVSYKFKPTMLPTPDIESYNRNGSKKYCNQFIKNNISIILEKDLDFEIENESRCFVVSDENNRIDLDLDKIMKGLIIGDRCPPIFNDIIKQNCKGIDLHKANFQAGLGYSLIEYS